MYNSGGIRRSYSEMSGETVGGGRSNFKRHRGEEKREDTLHERLIKLGDVGSQIETDLAAVAELVHTGMDKNKEELVESICRCCIAFPSKVTVYSALIGIINEKDYGFCALIIETLSRGYKDYLEAQQWEEAIVIVHILANLVTCHTVRNVSLLSLFESMLEVTVVDNTPQCRSDYFVYTVLSALPYVGRDLVENKSQELSQIMNTIETYVAKRQKTHVSALSVWPTNAPIAQVEYIDSLWTQICRLKNDNWSESYIYRPYEQFAQTLKANMAHSLARIDIPAHHPSNTYPTPKVIFRIFDSDLIDDTNVPIPVSDSYERFYFEQQLRYMMMEQYEDCKTCARTMLYIQNADKVPIGHICAEVVLGELFVLPRPIKVPIFYEAMASELCKVSKDSFLPAFNQAVKIAFEYLGTMNITCVDRFVSLFAFYLNNSTESIEWTWNEWAGCLNEDPLHPKQVFIRELIIKYIRISFYKKAEAMFKGHFESLIPPQPDAKDKFFSDGSDMEPGHALAIKIKQMIAKKVELSEYNSVLNINNGGDDQMQVDEQLSDHLMKIDVFVTVLLNMASKSLTHLFSGIGKFQHILKALMKSDDSQLQLLNTTHTVFNTNPLMQVVLIDKLLKIQLLTPTVVCVWIFSPSMQNVLTESYVWEILHNTVERQSALESRVRQQLCDAKEIVAKALQQKTLGSTNGNVSASNSDGTEQEPESEAEKKVSELEERLEHNSLIEERIFFIIFERFTKILSEHIRSCESTGRKFINDHWFRWMIGRMQQVFLVHHRLIHQHVQAIEPLFMASDTHLLLIFRQFLSLRA